MKVHVPEWMRKLGRVTGEQGSSMFVEVPLSRLEKAMEKVRERGIETVIAISGHDNGKEMEVLYHFVHRGVVLTVKARAGREEPVPTVTGLFPNAMLFEQENHEMLGIDFRGNRKLRQVLLGKGSPKAPLRKKVPAAGPGKKPVGKPAGDKPSHGRGGKE